jgi:hypothetical protein
MSGNLPPRLAHPRETTRNRFASRSTALAALAGLALFATFTSANSPASGSTQDKQKKPEELHWDPPQVDDPVPGLSSAPPCSLHDVLRQAGRRAAELVDLLQNFDAQEHLRFEQTDRLGMAEMYITENFDYLVDFGEQSGPLKIQETRTPLAGSDNAHLRTIVDKGLPVLALIFYPEMQSDYEMRCEGFTQWHNLPAWAVYFHQVDGVKPRTLSMGTAANVFPVSLKGRAWIAPDTGQIMHLETNLVKAVPIIELRANAVAIDYAPVDFPARHMQLWLPKSAVAYTDYGERRTIIEHTFSDFQLFSVQTRQVIEKPKEIKKPDEKP